MNATPIPDTQPAPAPITVIPHPRYPATDLYVPTELVRASQAILRGRFGFDAFPGEPKPRSLLDLAAGAGVFAAWAFSRWPYLWCDLCEDDDELRKLCLLNAPPGTRVHKVSVLEQLATIERTKAPKGGVFIAVNDVVHLRATETPLEDLRIDWAATKIVVIEGLERSAAFVEASIFFHAIGLELVACDPTFQTWVRA